MVPVSDFFSSSSLLIRFPKWKKILLLISLLIFCEEHLFSVGVGVENAPRFIDIVNYFFLSGGRNVLQPVTQELWKVQVFPIDPSKNFYYFFCFRENLTYLLNWFCQFDWDTRAINFNHIKLRLFDKTSYFFFE